MGNQPEDADKTLNTGDAGSVGFGVVPDGDDSPEAIASAAFQEDDKVTVIASGEKGRVEKAIRTQTGHFVYRVKLVDATNDIKGVAICSQNDLARRGYRAVKQEPVKTTGQEPVKRLKNPDQIALVHPIQQAASRAYRNWLGGTVNAADLQPVLRQARIVASRFARQFPRGERNEMPRILKGLERAYRKAVEFQAGNLGAKRTAVHWLYQELALLNEMLGGVAPPIPKVRSSKIKRNRQRNKG